MPDVNFLIDRYWIYHYPASEPNSAYILCYGYGSSGPDAHLRFVRDGVDIPDNICSAEGVVFLNFSAYQFQEVIETLRRERPVSISWTERNKRGKIHTGREPVGEEEP